MEGINDDKKDYRSIQAWLTHRHRWTAPSAKIEANVNVRHDKADFTALSDEQLMNFLKEAEQARLRLEAANGEVIDAEVIEDQDG